MSVPVRKQAAVPGIIVDPLAGGVIFEYAAAAPTATAAGYAPGCIYIDTLNGVVYKNTGSATSATWEAVSGAASGSFTVASITALTVPNGGTIATGTGTGAKIGTATGQKLGFFNATPVTQQGTTGTTAGFTSGAGTTAKQDSVYTGGTGTAAYTVGDVVLALKNLGFLAP